MWYRVLAHRTEWIWFRNRLYKTKFGSLRHLCSSTNGTQVEASLCIVGNGALGNPRCLMLSYNEQLFMFNCGEGVQRILPDFGFKASRVNRLFVTSNNWSNVSGLSSFLLARYDAGLRHIDIVGLDNAKTTAQCISFDTKLKRLKYNYFDCNSSKPDLTLVHDLLNIEPVVLQDGSLHSVVYLAKLSAQKGTIDLDKCFRLRVPRHLVCILENGESIQLSDGSIVRPADVSHPDQPEKRFIVLECLTSQMIKQIEQNPKISDFLHRCNCVVHFTKNQLLNNPDYRHLMDNISSSHHLLIVENNPSLCSYSAHRFQNQLNHLDSIIFPSLKEPTTLDVCVGDNADGSFYNKNPIYSTSGLSYKLRPHTEESSQLITLERILITNLKDKDNFLLYKDGIPREGLDEAIQTLRQKQKTVQKTTKVNYPEFIFLGTASSLSLPIRSTSAILVRLSERESILLDCGENCYGQLLRFYGKEQIEKVLSTIQSVFISHHHSDHHMGLVELIERRYEYNCKKLHIILPPMVSKYLHAKSSCFHSLNDLGSKYYYTINKHFQHKDRSIFLKRLPSIKQVELIPVSHCAFAYGISFTTKSGFKFVYSGDTQPCDDLVQAGRDCDLLIHEATVEDSLVQFARSNFHSTMSEAIEAGKRMGARFTILTHFSQRYGKLPFLPDTDHLKTVALAFDFMRVSPDELIRLPLMHKALQCMYSKHLLNLQHKSELYSRKYSKV